MNVRAVGYEVVVFVTQWGLMLLGFGILTEIVAPLNLLDPTLSLGRYFDAAGSGPGLPALRRPQPVALRS